MQIRSDYETVYSTIIADLFDVTDLLLKLLDVLLGVCTSSVGAVQGHLEFVDVLFQFLLAAKCVGLASSLGLKARLHRVKSPLVIAPEDVKS